MALREYRDHEGVVWRVWSVQPGDITGQVATMPEELQAGWLCFECDNEKRRLRPLPSSWEQRSDHELDLLRRAADPVRKR